MYKLILFIYLFLYIIIPIQAFATLNAGVVNGIWFSTTEPKEGEEVTIFTAIQNQSSKTIIGTVAFLVGGEIVGSSNFMVKQNDIEPVSTVYVFKGGDYDVSAYITSVKNNSVTYSIVPKTSVSVSSKQIVDNAKENSVLSVSKTTIPKIIDEITIKGKNKLTKIEPIVESTANRIEDLRDSIIEPSVRVVNDISISNTPTEKEIYGEAPITILKNKIEASKKLLEISKSIFKSENLSLWKKGVGIALSLLAFFIRIWFIFVILLFLFVFWRIVRKYRIY